jgi:hypothetical protein
LTARNEAVGFGSGGFMHADWPDHRLAMLAALGMALVGAGAVVQQVTRRAAVVR